LRRRSSVARLLRAPVVGGAALALLLAQPRAAAAQAGGTTESLFERFGLDRLRLTAVGVGGGVVKPTQMEGTEAYAVHADYGEIAPRWRVVFSATYWGSRLTDKAVQAFADTLRRSVTDPTGDFTVDLGRVTVQDIALDMDLRWAPRREARFRPYVSGGVGAHVLNAEGRAISGTFVERALDNITTGVTTSAGVDLVLIPQLSIGMQARYDLLSGARFGSLRAVGSYLLRPRATPAAP
jgi:hypothetical protein